MDEKSSKSVDILMCGAALALVGIVIGHVYLDDLLMGVKWFASTVVEPVFGLDRHF